MNLHEALLATLDMSIGLCAKIQLKDQDPVAASIGTILAVIHGRIQAIGMAIEKRDDDEVHKIVEDFRQSAIELVSRYNPEMVEAAQKLATLQKVKAHQAIEDVMRKVAEKAERQ